MKSEKTMNKFSEPILLPEQNHEIYLFDPSFVFFCGLILSQISMQCLGRKEKRIESFVWLSDNSKDFGIDQTYAMKHNIPIQTVRLDFVTNTSNHMFTHGTLSPSNKIRNDMKVNTQNVLQS